VHVARETFDHCPVFLEELWMGSLALRNHLEDTVEFKGVPHSREEIDCTQWAVSIIATLFQWGFVPEKLFVGNFK
jgi:hypothetical protein